MLAQFQLLPEQASTYAADMDALFWFLTALTAFFTTLIAVLVLYFAIKYRRRSPDERPPRKIAGSFVLEAIWTVIPLLIVLFIFVWSTRLLFSWGRPPSDTMDVYMVGKQWMWKTQHLGGQREINRLHVPVNQPVKVTLTSQDVIHSFFVPAFRTHQDAIPGRYTAVWFQATKPGTYALYCSEYCGTGHATMIGEVVVLNREAFRAWLDAGPDGSLASEGRKLFQKLQCVACHSADARARGPVLEQLYDTRVPLKSGGSTHADETYIRESIFFPEAKIVAGFEPIMPSYKGIIDEEEMVQLIAFIKTLKPGQTPSRTEKSEPPSAPPRLDQPQGK
jgi:cytochrome c oxidase subunit 2